MKNLAVTGGIRCLAMSQVVVTVSMGRAPTIWVREGASAEAWKSSNLQMCVGVR